MNYAGVFSGVGGFTLAAERAGWNIMFECEINPFGRKILKHYWPESIIYEDITTTDFTVWRGRIDVFSGGFPCQDASDALQTGNGQKGLKGERTGLFYHMVRAIDESRPKYVVAENVANILKINRGEDFRTILSELARMGYNAEWRICRASEVGAPHHRARLYLVAYSNSIRIQGNKSFFSLLPNEIKSERRKITGTNVEINAANEWLGESPVYCLDDGLSAELDIITESIKAFGNAVVPQLPLQIFNAINLHEHSL